VTVKVVAKSLTDDMIAFDIENFGGRLIQVNYSLRFIENKHRFIEAIDYCRDPIITIAKCPFCPHSQNSAGAFCVFCQMIFF
jgi:hypothetical protein